MDAAQFVGRPFVTNALIENVQQVLSAAPAVGRQPIDGKLTSINLCTATLIKAPNLGAYRKNLSSNQQPL